MLHSLTCQCRVIKVKGCCHDESNQSVEEHFDQLSPLLVPVSAETPANKSAVVKLVTFCQEGLGSTHHTVCQKESTVSTGEAVDMVVQKCIMSTVTHTSHGMFKHVLSSYFNLDNWWDQDSGYQTEAMFLACLDKD